MSVHFDERRQHFFFIASINGKQYKRSSVKWNTERKAILAERKFINEFNEGIVESKDFTVKDIGDRYLSYLKTIRRPSTHNTVTRVFKNHIYDYFGDRKIQSITRFDIEAYQGHLLSKTYTHQGETKLYSNDHLSKVQTQANLLFKYAVSHKIINSSPFDGVENAKHITPDKRRDPILITYEEYRDFIEVVDDVTYRALFSTIYWCGIRPGEALGLSIEDLDIENKRLYIRHGYDSVNKFLGPTKTENKRFLGITEENLEELKVLLKEYEGKKVKGHYPLFGLEARIPRNTLRNNFERYKKLAKSKPFTLYDLRRSHVSLLIKLGLTPFEISKRMGHSLEMVTEVYGYLWKDDEDRIMDKLNSIVD